MLLAMRMGVLSTAAAAAEFARRRAGPGEENDGGGIWGWVVGAGTAEGVRQHRRPRRPAEPGASAAAPGVWGLLNTH
ncbi:hypothetical protein MNEG_7847, partial [Monoraphidium neglectum]